MLSRGQGVKFIANQTLISVKTADRQVWTFNIGGTIIPKNPMEDISKGSTSANLRVIGNTMAEELISDLKPDKEKPNNFLCIGDSLLFSYWICQDDIC